MTRRLSSIAFDLTVVGGVLALTRIGWAQIPVGLNLLGVAMAVALVVRRRWPSAVMLVVAAAALAQVVAFPRELDPQPFDVAVVIAMYSVVKYAPRMLDAYLAGGIVAVGVVIEALRHASAGIPLLVLYGGVSAAIWLTAYVVRNRRVYLATLEERASTLEREREHLARIAVADERSAIARELHDVVAHSLSVMIVQADGGRYAFDADPARARTALDTVAATGRGALEDMRRLVGVLRGSETDPGPPDDRRSVGLGQLEAFADGARSAGLAVTLEVAVADEELPPSVGLTVARIVQEALTNSLRHAGPGARATVRVAREGDAVLVSCVDDGGIARPAASPGSGHGLVGMRERVAVHKGALRVGPVLAQGWGVEASIPVGAAVPRVVEGAA